MTVAVAGHERSLFTFAFGVSFSCLRPLAHGLGEVLEPRPVLPYNTLLKVCDEEKGQWHW